MSDLTKDKIRAIARSKAVPAPWPLSVYRIQLNKEFTFLQARDILSYLKELGIEAVYLSPIFQAVPGSMHGYNVTDPTQINPELGTREDFNAFSDAAKEMGMGLILDVVPNHMGIAANNNRWWNDLLENGPGSRYAHFFDIDWSPVKKQLRDKILIPVLGGQYGKVLESGELKLFFSEGAFFVAYWDRHFPVAPDTYVFIMEQSLEALKAKFQPEDRDWLEYLSVLASLKNLPPRTELDAEKKEERHREKEIAKERLKTLCERSPVICDFIAEKINEFNGVQGQPRTFDRLHELLDLQSFRLAYWRVAAEEINYRRFFDINDLAAIRVEVPDVFEACHDLIFKLIREGRIQGLRIDHPDGLYDPVGYLGQLQQKYLFQSVCAELEGPLDALQEGLVREVLSEEAFKTAKPLYVVVEKILGQKEHLPSDWPVAGTVGYEYLNHLNGLFIDSDYEKKFSEIYEWFIGHPIDFDRLLYDKKKFFALIHMSSEINTLGHRLDLISEDNRKYRDFTRNNLTLAIREVIACFPVYRTYICRGTDEVSTMDEKHIRMAVERAKKRTPALNPAVYDFLRDVLLLKLEKEEVALYRDFILKFQQLTGPLMAKGLEDTSFYIYNRFLALNEVGGDPLSFGCSVEDFHKKNIHRSECWPGGLIATSTHDTKRSSDVRLRLDVLSEMPEEWQTHLSRWSVLHAKYKTLVEDIPEPRGNTEYFIYQTLMGIWPNEPLTSEKRMELENRVLAYCEKALREAKTYTNWTNPNQEYEDAVKKFIQSVMNPVGNAAFFEDFLPFQKRVSELGQLNSLSAEVLKIGSPGVVDHYQGSVIWNYTLVDPDNRRSVDYALRKKLLKELQSREAGIHDPSFLTAELLRNRECGEIKLYLVRRGLHVRKRNQEVFRNGAYVPLKAEGPRERNVIAFMREKDGRQILVIAARFFAGLSPERSGLPLGEPFWKDTRVLLPGNFSGSKKYQDVFTGRNVAVQGKSGRLSVYLADVFQILPAAMFEEV